MSDNDLIRRSDALNALRLGETITKLQARIAALPTVTDLGKTQRIIAARDRRIARLVSALNDARAKGYVTPAEQEPALVLSAAPPAPSSWRPIETAPKTRDDTLFGPLVVLASESGHRAIGYWGERCGREGWVNPHDHQIMDYWNAFTHWQPLDEPPLPPPPEKGGE